MLKGYKIVLPVKYKLKISDNNKRIVAYLIDVIMFLVFFSLPYLSILFFNLNMSLDNMDISLLEGKYNYVNMIYSFTNLLIFLFYLSISEYLINATIGKKLMKIQVKTINGKKLTFFKSVFRNLTKSIFIQFLFFDIFPMFFDMQKRRVSDFIIKTVVVENKKTIKKFPEVINIWMKYLIYF